MSKSSTRKKEYGPDPSQAHTASTQVLAATHPQDNMKHNLVQHGVSPTQAAAWIHNHETGVYHLPDAQLARYRAILADSTKLDAIARLAAVGGTFCRVVGKSPDIGGKNWWNKPFTERQIRAIWQGSVGLLCGKQVGEGQYLVVVDVDDYGYKAFCERFPGRANTLTIGHQGKPDRAKLVYLLDGPLPPKGQSDKSGLEFLSAGKQAVIQGIHEDGHPYQVWNDAPIQVIPAEALNKLWHKATGKWLYPQAKEPRQRVVEHSQSPPVTLAPGQVDYYANAVLRRECEAVAMEPPGNRNNRLWQAACNLYELVAAGRLAGHVVENELYNAACKAGLDGDTGGSHGILATIRSGARKGLQHPRYDGLPQAKEDLSERVLTCGDVRVCGKGKRYLDPHKPNSLMLIPWYCDDFRNCSTCARKKANAIKARIRRAMADGATVYYTFLDEKTYRAMVREMGKESIIRIPQPDNEVVCLHTDSGRPGMPVNERFLEDLYSLVRAMPHGKRESGKLGARQGGKQDDQEDEKNTIPMKLDWIETNAGTTELEDSIYAHTWARLEGQAMARLAGPGGVSRIEECYAWLMEEYKQDLQQAGIRITAGGGDVPQPGFS